MTQAMLGPVPHTRGDNPPAGVKSNCAALAASATSRRHRRRLVSVTDEVGRRILHHYRRHARRTTPMSIRHHGKALIKIALLAATLTTAILLGVASRQGPPFDTYITPGGRLLHCDQLHRDLQAAYKDQLKQNDSPKHAAGLAYRHIARRYNRHDGTGDYPDTTANPALAAVRLTELNDAYRQCARGRE